MTATDIAATEPAETEPPRRGLVDRRDDETMAAGSRADGLDLRVRRRAHPALVVRLVEEGPSLRPFDVQVDTRQEYDRISFQPFTQVIPLGGSRLELAVQLVPGSEVVPEELIAALVRSGAAPTEAVADLEALCADLVGGGLLVDPVDESTPPPPCRLMGYTEARAGGPGSEVAEIGPHQLVSVRLPLALVPDGSRFALYGHDGTVRCRLAVDEVHLLHALPRVGTIHGATAQVLDAMPAERSPEEVRGAVGRLLRRLAAAGLVELVDPSIHLMTQAIGDADQSRARSAPLFEAACEALRPRWEANEDAIVVVPVDVDVEPLLSLGTISAYADAHLPADVADRVVLLPIWHTSAADLPAALERLPPRQLVFLYSLYIWNHHELLEVARAVRSLRPGALNIAGGPDLPKYEHDSERYLLEHTEIDVAVRGEGEVTLCDLLATLARHGPPAGSDRPPELDGVPGISFRRGGTVVRTPDRDRLADLDQIPSPYLTGRFDHIERLRLLYPILETNRGCPYGCTFCDWGSATLSRIRKFDLERVKAEIDWLAEHGCIGIGFGDANFGMLDRDVEITRHLVAVKERTGLPNAFGVNMAKNRVGNTLEIVSLLTEAGIISDGMIAVQTYDPVVLRSVRRANIRPAVFDDLAAEFRRRELPLSTDVMLGLPGSTPATFRADLQRTVDTEVHARAHPTQLLVNSPMNAPEYRAEHGIVGEAGGLVTSTTSYTEAEWRQMMRMRQFFYFAERRGMLRQLAAYVRAETATAELAFYDHLRALAEESPRHPHLAYVLSVAAVSYLPPGHWSPLLEEVAGVMVDDVGVPDDAALSAVLRAQLALFLSSGRSFPVSIDLDHDVVAWHRDVLAAKLANPDGGWPAQVAPLRSYGPGQLVVDDRRGRCKALLGRSTVTMIDNHNDWELDSPLARPVAASL